MKWQNKGHEFDTYGEKLAETFHERGDVFYIFGAGFLGSEIRAVIEKTGCFGGFIDNDERKQLSGVNGVKVFSLQEYLKMEKKGLVILAVDISNVPTIAKQLCAAGLKLDKDYYEWDIFMKRVFPILSVYANKQVYVELAQICLTERCTLKCRKCAHACYAVGPESEDMSIEQAKESADSFFAHVDMVKEFVLIGGEPFLYRELGKIITYIGERYRDKMVIFSITTNGTILPDRAVLDLCEKYRVTVRISDYSGTLKRLEEKYTQIKEVLENNGVIYTISEKETKWMDYGFETVNRGGVEEELISAFDRCKTPCREIRGSHYYYCVMARSVSDNLKMETGKTDYLDLKELTKEDQKILLEFQMGYSEKGYLDMCNHCHGADASNYPILAAEQMKRNVSDEIISNRTSL